MAESSVPAPQSKSGIVFGVALAGAASWCVDTSILWVLAVHAGAPTWLAAGCGYLVAGVINFMINRAVFRAQDGQTHRQTMRFALMVAVNAVIVALLVPVLSSAIKGSLTNRNVRLIVAKIITTAALLPFNAIGYHRWVFAPHTDRVPAASAGSLVAESQAAKLPSTEARRGDRPIGGSEA